VPTGCAYRGRGRSPQLLEFSGEWIACRPVEEDVAVILAPLTGADLEVAQRVLDELDDAF
jgi:hypothetical protein